MKNDQDGSRPRDPRHGYANPTMPEICPVLGRGVYFAVFGFARDGKRFPGGNQYSRFLKVLKSVLSGELMQRTLVVGRYVAGLPFDSPKFAALPPFFDVQSDQEADRLELRQRIDVAMKAVFPGVPASLRMICQFGLASILFHKSFLQQSLPTNQLLFATPLFSTRNEAQFEWLRRRVVCRNFQEHDPISPSGIPPHMGIMVALTDYKELMGLKKDWLLILRKLSNSTLTDQL
ncbi:hypothetical protein PHYSODRAFT_470731 [Phytophthora sojae]|uniref:Uncharacterized protein n=1 Tax=Phytophthora sojae (strain P6497) TaxID=1094619 RepID=G4YLD9_PHYSP|nr:hypothetical protein PHYSODRAFT_470731 [Phytophthora sojae]EGZ30207.1 hypothetical protein PHYSODRAFT_470731 [Phytophthora sojae]|eukprot:XP_009517482.1 hypothetical protein PHYSODRAFT_470731 [Phytophthora sojae]